MQDTSRAYVYKVLKKYKSVFYVHLRMNTYVCTPMYARIMVSLQMMYLCVEWTISDCVKNPINSTSNTFKTI